MTYNKLLEFYKEVARLTLNHDSFHFSVMNGAKEEQDIDYAVVFPSKLGAALEKVDPEWVTRAATAKS